LFAILAGSAAWACFGERGIIVNTTLVAEIESREVRLDERRGVIAHLHREIEHMRRSPRVQERWVREELGFVRPGEVVFVFPADRDADFDLLEDRRLPAPAEVGAPGPGDESNGATEPGVSG
jgi:cell division protein FtsB